MFGLFKKEEFSHIPKAIRPIMKLAFPSGEKQLNQETKGFLEAFHVLGTHPEVIHTASWANTQYDVFGPTVTRFLQTVATGNPNETQSENTRRRHYGKYSYSIPASN